MKLYIRLCKCGKFDADHTKQKNGENMKIMENNQNAGKYFAERKKQKNAGRIKRNKYKRGGREPKRKSIHRKQSESWNAFHTYTVNEA